MGKKYFKILLLCFIIMSMTIGCSDGKKESTQSVASDRNETSKETVEETSFEEKKREEERNEILKSNQGQPMTLMIYMVGSDLEAATAAATNDMNEMTASGVDLSKVQLLVYTGGSPKWHNPDIEIPTDKHTVYELTKEGFVQVSDFEAMSMGEPTSLSRFLQYGYENYPSETYGLILWDHGNGPVMGYGSDLLYDKDALTLPEIRKALENSPFSAEQKLSFIGFDACLMASAELACMVDDYADYLIASQEVEPGFGWNYEVLEYCGKVDVPTFIQWIVEDYLSYSEAFFAQNPFFKSEVTLAAVDLSYADELEKAIDQLFGEASENVQEDFNKLALERVETRAFGRATTGSEYDLVDIQALMDSMGGSYKKESKAIQDVLEKMVIYNDSNTVQSCGISLYYPYYNKKYYEASWKDSYAELGLFPNYMKYLEGYGEIWLGTDMKEYFSGRLVANDAGSGTYTLQLNEEQNEHFADAGFYILRQMGEDGYSAVYYSTNVTNEEGTLTAKFDGNVLYYSDDLGFKGIPITRVLDEVDGEIRYAVFPILTGSVNDFLSSESLNCRVVLSVNPETQEVSVLDFSESGDEEIQTGKRPQVNLDDWVRIQFFEIRSRYLTRDEDGRVKHYWEWPEGDWILWNEIALADGLNFTYEKMYDDGENYFLMFNLMDVQGNQYSSELFPIALEEAPEIEEAVLTDAGTLEDDSKLIFDREGIKLYLELVKDDVLRETSYCFRAENSNDFPVHLYINNLMVNESIDCSDRTGYLSIDAQSTEYEFMEEITSVCMNEKILLPEQIVFSIRLSNADNDKTLINNETFLLHISEDAKPIERFLEYRGARAENQIILDEENGLKITLLNAGYQFNCSNCKPDGEYARFTGILRIENRSDEIQNVHLDGIEINRRMISSDMIYSDYAEGQMLNPGQVFYYVWELDAEEMGLEENENIESVAVHCMSESETRSLKESLAVQLAGDKEGAADE